MEGNIEKGTLSVKCPRCKYMNKFSFTDAVSKQGIHIPWREQKVATL